MDRIPKAQKSIRQLISIVNRYATENSDQIVNIVCGTDKYEKRFRGIYTPEITLSSCLLFHLTRKDGWDVVDDNRLVDIEKIMLENI